MSHLSTTTQLSGYSAPFCKNSHKSHDELFFRHSLAVTIAAHVAGLEFEATEGQNVSMYFETGLERVDEVRIFFEGESKRERLLVRYCFPAAVLTCHPFKTQHLQVEGGNVSMILLKVNISSSGLYTAQVITAANQMSEVTATLVVNQAPVSFTTSPSHFISPKPLSSSDLRGLYALIPAVVIIIILCFCFWKLRKRSNTADDEEATGTPAVSRSSVSTKNNSWKKDCGDCVAVAMNGCGENAEALLAS